MDKTAESRIPTHSSLGGILLRCLIIIGGATLITSLGSYGSHATIIDLQGNPIHSVFSGLMPNPSFARGLDLAARRASGRRSEGNILTLSWSPDREAPACIALPVNLREKTGEPHVRNVQGGDEDCIGRYFSQQTTDCTKSCGSGIRSFAVQDGEGSPDVGYTTPPSSMCNDCQTGDYTCPNDGIK